MKLPAALAWALLLAAAAPAGAQPACAARTQQSVPAQGFAQAAARNSPSVVSIIVVRPRRSSYDDESDPEYFHNLSGLPIPDPSEAAGLDRTTASGFAIADDGSILTNAHVVFDARETWVVAADGRRFPASVAGFDRRTDVALLRIEGGQLPAAPVAPTAPVCPGDWVAALGAPFGFEQTITAGIVSAFPRFLPGSGAMPLIQTDAALNPGSSGGPLFNADGQVIGMNSMVFSSTGIFVGVSFALPIERVLRIAAHLRASGRVRRGDIGAHTQPLTGELAQAFGFAQPRGLLVTRVAPAGPAERAGIRIGDVLAQPSAESAAQGPDREDFISDARPGTRLALDVWRGKSRMAVSLQVAEAGGATAPPVLARPPVAEAQLGLRLAPSKVTAQMPAGVYVDSASGASLVAGIETGDRIIGVNRIPVASQAEFEAALDSLAGAGVVALLVGRGNLTLYIAVDRRGR